MASHSNPTAGAQSWAARQFISLFKTCTAQLGGPPSISVGVGVVSGFFVGTVGFALVAEVLLKPGVLDALVEGGIGGVVVGFTGVGAVALPIATEVLVELGSLLAGVAAGGVAAAVVGRDVGFAVSSTALVTSAMARS